MEVLQIRSLEEFRKQLLRETGVSFCTREHFGEALAFENQYYVRYYYNGIDVHLAGSNFNVPQIRLFWN